MLSKDQLLKKQYYITDKMNNEYECHICLKDIKQLKKDNIYVVI